MSCFILLCGFPPHSHNCWEETVFSRPTRFHVALVALVVLAMLAVPLAAGAAAPTNGFTNPADGATLSGTVDVTGYANDPHFQKW